MITEKHVADRVSNESHRGYWSVNNRYFFNKQECAVYAGTLPNPVIKFHYFDDFYKNLNWSVEPSESLLELYKRRAQSLRDKYDYVVLAYSGGADSTTVLESFVNNGIALDEVITSYPKEMLDKVLPTFDRNNKYHGNTAFEYYEAALPRLKWLAKEHPNVKISDLDSTSLAEEIVTSGKMMDFVQYGFPPTISLVSTYIKIYTRIREIADTGKSVCLVIGADKPRIAYNPSKKMFGTFFQDISFFFGALNGVALSGFKPLVENFYYNQDVPEITLKQCALVKKVLEPMFQSEDQDMIKKHKLIQFTAPNGSHIIDVHGNFVKKILYPNWDTNIFQAEKPPNPGANDGPGYQFIMSNLFEKRFLDYAQGQASDYYNTYADKLKLTDHLGRPREFFYTTDPIPLKFT
jgi:hypothetical protein